MSLVFFHLKASVNRRKLKNMKGIKPLLRGHIHQAMFFITFGACLLLILRSQGDLDVVSTIVFSIGALMMFGVSAIYHRINWGQKSRALMRKLDHSSIYLMIAGTFTPICLLALPPESGIQLLKTIWIVAAVGLLQSIFFVNLPKIISAIIYIIAGYLIIPYMGELSKTFSSAQFFLLISGGVAYTIGGLSYGLKRPQLSPKYFGYHEVFHILVSVGAILHFALVYSLV